VRGVGLGSIWRGVEIINFFLERKVGKRRRGLEGRRVFIIGGVWVNI